MPPQFQWEVSVLPNIYLSPSTQESNEYVTGGSEEYHMNILADALEPYLRASGIRFTRNTPEMTARSSIRASNAGDYDLHLALHSNAAPPDRYGTVRGSDIYYAPNSQRGQTAANIIAENIREIYPLPDLVRAIPTTSIGEVVQTRAPAAFIELAYHDNEEDAEWIVDNTDQIARTIALALTEYFNTPFVWPITPRTGTVTLTSGTLNLRSGPNMDAPVIGSIPNRAQVTILGQLGDWYSVEYGDNLGFVNRNFVR